MGGRWLETIGTLPGWFPVLLGALFAFWFLRRVSVERPRHVRGRPAPSRRDPDEREKQWQEVARGLIRYYRRDPAVREEAGRLELTAAGREILELSGVKDFVDRSRRQMMGVMERHRPENHGDVLLRAVVAFFEAEPDDGLEKVEEFLSRYKHYRGSAVDIKLLGVLAAVYLRDIYMENKGLR